MSRMIAYCGLVCSECEAYLATQAGDQAVLQKLADQWSEQFGQSIKPTDILCDGCPTNSSRLCGYCSECPVRACAIDRGVVTCAHCDDYGCEIITGFLEQAPTAKTELVRIRASLQT